MLSFQGYILLGGDGAKSICKFRRPSFFPVVLLLYWSSEYIYKNWRIKQLNLSKLDQLIYIPQSCIGQYFDNFIFPILPICFFQISYKCGNTKFLTDNIWKWKSCPFNQFLNTAKRALQPKQISWMTLVWFFVFSLLLIERQWLDFSRFSSFLEKILRAGKDFKVWLGRDYSGCRRLFVSCLDSLSLLITSDFGFKFSLKHSQTLHCILRRWWVCNYQMTYRQLVI